MWKSTVKGADTIDLKVARIKYNSFIKNEIIKQYKGGMSQKCLSHKFNIHKSVSCTVLLKIF